MPVARRAISTDDRLVSAAVSHAVSAPPTHPLDLSQALRLRNPRRADATWWLLEEEGRAVSTLVCYPLDFAVNGQTVPGYGLGAVGTLPEARGRGFAASLCRAAIAGAEAGGRSVGLLYSAIPPAYYERLGFRVVPAWRPSCTQPAALATSGPQAAWRPVDPRREAAALAATYERHHRGPHLYRDPARFLRNVELSPGDVYFGLGTPLVGYVRLAVEDGTVEVVEDVVPDADRPAVLRAAGRLAVGIGAKAVEGWFAPCEEVAPFFRDLGRGTTLPMLRGVPDTADASFFGSDYF